MRALLEDVPTMNVEVEMAARLESKTGALSANDVLDIQSFYTAIPYSDRVVAEKARSEEHTSELQSLMRNSYAVFCLKKNNSHINAETEAYNTFHTNRLPS